MCGRYYVDDETAREIEKMVRDLDAQLLKERKDVYPTNETSVLVNNQNNIGLKNYKWGFPITYGKGILINARAETALEKKTFRNSILQRRCIIPAKGFYEWNKEKNKFTFTRKDKKVMYMAGCYNCFNDTNCFVILTTKANVSVEPVHNRMPLILEAEEVKEWLFHKEKTEDILQKTPKLLEVEYEYKQETLNL